MPSGSCLVPGPCIRRSSATREESNSTPTHSNTDQRRCRRHTTQPVYKAPKHLSTNPGLTNSNNSRKTSHYPSPWVTSSALRRRYCIVHFISYMPPTCLALPSCIDSMVSQSNTKEAKRNNKQEAGCGGGKQVCEIYQINQSHPASQSSQPKSG